MGIPCLSCFVLVAVFLALSALEIKAQESLLGAPQVSGEDSLGIVVSHAKALRDHYETAMAEGDWVLTRCIQNVTTGQNITIEVLHETSGDASLIRSSVLIKAIPSKVAAYYKTEGTQEAQQKKTAAWSAYSALMNLVKVVSTETLASKNQILITKQVTAPPGGFFGFVLGRFWTNKVFTQGQVWFGSEKDVITKEPDTETIYGRKPSKGVFEIKRGTQTFVSATVRYKNIPSNAHKDTVYWFIPVGNDSTRVVSVSRTDIGIFKPLGKALYEYTAGASIVSIMTGLRSMAESGVKF